MIHTTSEFLSMSQQDEHCRCRITAGQVDNPQTSKQANIRPCQVAHTSLRHCQFGCLMRPVPLNDSHISKTQGGEV
uniref:Uncharacterized protein n=1 Tax=Oryza nivara TaxID=4536 RepID=A0A0E0GAU8_ORYNI